MRATLRFLLLGLFVLTLTASAQNDDGVIEDDEDGSESTDTAPKAEYHPPTFEKPSIDKKETYFVDWFDDLKGIGKHWIKSIAKKEGVDESLAKYNGEWQIGSPAQTAIENDYGLIVKTKARHHAIAAKLRRPFEFGERPLVVQYEVKYEDGQECGGGYVKLLSADSLNIHVFNDKTPYTIMFGPDKCGSTAKIHFIIRLKNPKNDTYSEHHAPQSTASLASYFEDKATHLYTLVITPDNKFNVLVDHVSIMSGNMLTDLEPTVVPPKEIPDPEDKKPADWDEREHIVDAEAKKPEDWDEDAPPEIIDEDAVKPSDWLEDEEALVDDPTATKPDDWNDAEDGEWEPKKIDNPKCEGRSGCGKWTKPMKPNPAYKGKWSPPKIANPAYKGRWSARLVANPHYYEVDPYKQMASIGAVGFELWTMSADIVFDNILIADSVELAREFARETFDFKVAQEKLRQSIVNPTKGVIQQVLDATEERPWIWVVVVLVILVPIILFFGKRSSSSASHPKKTDEVLADYEPENEDEEQEGDVEETQDPELPTQSAGQNSADEQGTNSEASEQSASSKGSAKKKRQEPTHETKKDAADSSEPETSPSAPRRRTRVRRD